MFKSQLSALAAVSITMALDRAESAVQVQTRIIGAFDLWFEKTSSQRVLWPQTVALSLDYFDTLSRHAVPLDERAIAALAKSATALDAYCWLAQRLHRAPVGVAQFIPWDAVSPPLRCPARTLSEDPSKLRYPDRHASKNEVGAFQPLKHLSTNYKTPS